MKNPFKEFVKWLKTTDGRIYLTHEKEKEVYKEIIDGVIDAKSGSDLKILLDKLQIIHWSEPTRYMFLLGLIQGTLMQFKKDVSVEELKQIFYNL